jgi:D-glycerate 3-kinase
MTEDPAGWMRRLCDELWLPDGYVDDALGVVAPLAGRIAALRGAEGRPVVIGVCGAQGSGKTTLCAFLEAWLRREESLSAATLSLDDCYLDNASRQDLAAEVHPLLVTRGVPGTHDVPLAESLLRSLTASTGEVRLPVFDKVRDDRAPESAWRTVSAPVDVVLFEGWCVGTRAQPTAALASPINELEALADPDGSWRRYVNEQLATRYEALFGALDALVFLRVPSFERVFEWRRLQEEKMAGNMDAARLRHFISHFERLTRHALQGMPGWANAVVEVGADHRLAGLTVSQWPGDS